MSDAEKQTTKTTNTGQAGALGSAVVKNGVTAGEHAAPDTLKSRRVTELQNGEVRTKGGARIITPDSDVMAQITEETGGKVRYFPTPNPTEISDSVIGNPEFSRHIMQPLIDEIVARFPGRRLSLRSFPTSINGHMPPPEGGQGYDLWDIADTVAGGRNSTAMGGRFNVAPLDADERTSVHRVTQYASSVSFVRNYEMEPGEQEAATFPAVVVYDREGLQKENGVWAVSFKPDADPQDVMLAAYVLDCA